MLIGDVIGTVWGSRQAHGMAGVKLVVVRTADGAEIVAADKVGANPGETVLVANGSRVRDLVYDGRTPIKAVLVGIVDGVAR